jgi:hypothetical protein
VGVETITLKIGYEENVNEFPALVTIKFPEEVIICHPALTVGGVDPKAFASKPVYETDVK